MDFLLTEAGVRLGCFIGVLLAMAAWEVLAPRRSLIVAKPRRWGSNLGLVFLNSVLMRLVAPLGAVGVAVFAESQDYGLFHYIDAPDWLAILVSVILLDFAIYLQHVMFHAVPLFWRLHMVHHADLDFDVTTGLRFHTLEILLSFGIKAAVVLLMGPPALAVLVFEVLLNATSMFNHSNIRMPLLVDRVLRWIVVTPDMHRVHHSVHRRETNSNFGFSLPWWDKMLGTYRDQPIDGHTGMRIGLSHIRDEKRADRLLQMLTLPFQRQAESYGIEVDAEKQGDEPASRTPPCKVTPEYSGTPPQLNPFLDAKLAARYEEWYLEPGQQADQLEKRLLGRLLRRFGGVRSVLEIGCGTGHFTRWMRGLDYDATGLDSSPVMLEQARLLDGGVYVSGDALALPFPDRAFDITVLITTLEFISQPNRALAEAVRVSQNGLLLGVINRRSLLGRHYRHSSNPLWTSAQFYTPFELKQMIQLAAGERLLDVSWRTTIWPVPFLKDLPLPWGGFIGLAARWKP